MKKAGDLIDEKGTTGNMGVAAAWHYILNEEEPASLEKADKLVELLWAEKDKNLPKISLFLARSTLKNIQKKYNVSL